MRALKGLLTLQAMRAAAIIARRGRSSLVSAPWLKDNLGDPKLRVLHVTQVLDRTTNTVAPAVDTYMTSHVPGARFVDVGGRLSTPNPKLHNLAPSPEQFAAELSRQGVDDGSSPSPPPPSASLPPLSPLAPVPLPAVSIASSCCFTIGCAVKRKR